MSLTKYWFYLGLQLFGQLVGQHFNEIDTELCGITLLSIL